MRLVMYSKDNIKRKIEYLVLLYCVSNLMNTKYNEYAIWHDSFAGMEMSAIWVNK